MAARRDLPIAKAIARAFQRAGFTSQDLLTGQIVHTDLPWQCPPLHCTAELDSVPLADYLAYSTPVDIDKLYDFWVRGLEELYYAPTKVIGAVGWRNTSSALPGMTFGERALRLSTPAGFPEAIDPLAGATFSMEVAQLVYNALGVKEFASTDYDYYAELADGRKIGIADGVPIAPSPWGISMGGQVQLHLAQGRGQEIRTCRYDLLAKVRSVLYENTERFVEFDGIDWGLQALAKLSGDQLCWPLQQAIENMSVDAFIAARKLTAVNEAIETMQSWSMHDRAKITSLYEILVPDVLKASQFQRSIFNMYQTIPAVLAPSTEKKILTFLKNLKQRLERECKPRDPSSSA